MKTVLFFGFYDRKYSRTRVLRHGFERNGWRVEECHVETRVHRGIAKYVRLMWQALRLDKKAYDLVLVGFPGHNAVPLAWLFFGKKVIYDAFLSQYETNVIDRKLYAANSWRGLKDRLFDTWACKLASHVLLDTESNIGYFVNEFSLPREKFVRVFIGADDEVFKPSSQPEPTTFTVHFHGTFIPVQGIQYIVEAAEILKEEDIHFRIVGNGQESERIDTQIREKGLEKKVERIPKVPLEDIPRFMANAHVVLGLFGEIDRALRAIPNKVFEGMAMRKAIITEGGVGVRELPNPEKLFYLVPAGSGKAIADAILDLKKHPEKRVAFGASAEKYFREYLLPEHIVRNLLDTIAKS